MSSNTLRTTSHMCRCTQCLTQRCEAAAEITTLVTCSPTMHLQTGHSDLQSTVDHYTPAYIPLSLFHVFLFNRYVHLACWLLRLSSYDMNSNLQSRVLRRICYSCSQDILVHWTLSSHRRFVSASVHYYQGVLKQTESSNRHVHTAQNHTIRKKSLTTCDSSSSAALQWVRGEHMRSLVLGSDEQHTPSPHTPPVACNSHSIWIYTIYTAHILLLCLFFLFFSNW